MITCYGRCVCSFVNLILPWFIFFRREVLWRYTITYAADILAGYQFLGACTSRVRLPTKSMDSNSRVNNTLFVYSGSKDTLQLWAHGEAPLVSGINVQVPKFVGWIYSPRSPPLSSTSSKTRTGNILFLHPSTVTNREARTPCKHKYTGDTILHPRKEFQIPIHSRACIFFESDYYLSCRNLVPSQTPLT